MSYVFINNSILVVFSVLSADPNLDYVGAGSAPLNGGCADVCAVPRSILPRPHLHIPRIRHCLTSMESKGAQLLIHRWCFHFLFNITTGKPSVMSEGCIFSNGLNIYLLLLHTSKVLLWAVVSL